MGEGVPGFEEAGQMEGDVGPLAAEVDRDVDIGGEWSGQVTLVPPRIAGGVSGGHGLEQAVPWVGVLAETADLLQAAVHVDGVAPAEPPVDGGMARNRRRRRDRPLR